MKALVLLGLSLTLLACAQTPKAPANQALRTYPASSAGQAPASSPSAFPPPSTAAAPPGAWVAPRITAEDKTHRATADAFFKRSKLIDASFMANVSFLKSELAQAQYDAMDSQLDSILSKSLADPAYELVEQDCANFAEDYSNIPSSDVRLLDAWVKARPKSAWAHYSRGLRWSHEAWIARGTGWASDLSDPQAQTLHEDETKARVELHQAVALDPRIAIAWVTLMDIDTTDASLGAVAQDYREAIKHRPASFLIPDKYEEALEPRWYGSYPEMVSLAVDLAQKTDVNARFWVFQGYASADQGCAACNDYDWLSSLAAYSAATVYGDRPGWLEQAGDDAVHIHRYALAHAFYERAKWYKPEDFDLVIDSDIMDAICDPDALPGKLEMLEKEAPQFSRVPARQYPRVAGDCDYYQAELPWGDEPLPDPGHIQAYSIQMESIKSAQQK